MMTRQRAALQAVLLLIGHPVAAVTAVGTAPFPGCNIGPTHHSHLIVPLSTSESACALPTAQFLLSHGATFFCPHTWDVKLLARIVEDDARATLCSSYFGAVDSDASPIHAFRPTFPQGGLPAEALGQVLTWQSPVIYHVHRYGVTSWVEQAVFPRLYTSGGPPSVFLRDFHAAGVKLERGGQPW